MITNPLPDNVGITTKMHTYNDPKHASFTR